MKLFQAIIFGYLAALAAASLLIAKSILMWFDAGYVASLQLPSDGDSLGIPLIGAVLFGGFLFFVISIMYISILATAFFKKKLRTVVALSDAALTARQGRFTKIAIIVIAALCVVFLYMPPFYLYVNPVFVITDAISGMLGVLAAFLLCLTVAGFTKKSKPKH